MTRCRRVASACVLLCLRAARRGVWRGDARDMCVAGRSAGSLVTTSEEVWCSELFGGLQKCARQVRGPGRPLGDVPFRQDLAAVARSVFPGCFGTFAPQCCAVLFGGGKCSDLLGHHRRCTWFECTLQLFRPHRVCFDLGRLVVIPGVWQDVAAAAIWPVQCAMTSVDVLRFPRWPFRVEPAHRFCPSSVRKAMG